MHELKLIQYSRCFEEAMLKFNCTWNQIFLGKETRLIQARQHCMMLLRDEGNTLQSIADAFQTSHQNVSHGVQAARKRLPE